MTTIEVPAPLGDDVLGEDWFGEGSVFDSGEELAAALLALVSAAPDAVRDAGAGREATSAAVDAVVVPSGPPPAPAGAPQTQLAEERLGEFQVAAMPSFVKRAPDRRTSPGAGWQRSPSAVSRPQGGGWSIRQSVQILRSTEESLVRLREEAADLAWQWALVVHREVGPVGAGAAASPD
jgi:hypothetical protein